MHQPIRKKVAFFLLFVLSGLPFIQAQVETGPAFKHLTVEDGLSNNWAKAILKDRAGFMWFGTFNGLNRYDGQKFKVFRRNEQNNLSDNFIESLAEDPHGNIWVGTFSGGLNLFDRKTETFSAFLHDPNDLKSISGNRIYAICPDKAGNLWVGTDAGLDRFDYATRTFDHFSHDPETSNSLTQGAVSCIFEDHNGDLWIGTQGGLNFFSPEDETFVSYRHQDNIPHSLAHNFVKSIYEDKYGHLWIGTWGGGLDKFDRDTKRFQHYRHTTGQQDGLSNNSVLQVLGDQENQIFVATEGGGLNIIDLQHETFRHFLPELDNERSLNSNSIHALYYDGENGLLWAGTYNGGINYFSKWDKPFYRYQAQVNGLNNNHVTCLAEDNRGKLWVGTDGGGVNILDVESGNFSYLTENEGLQNDAILSLLCDRQNRIWIGTYNGGLDLLENGNISHFQHDPNDSNSLGGKNVSAIYEDKRGNIWVGTMSGGLNLFLGKDKGFIRYQHDPSVLHSIVDNFIYGILEDRLGRLLVQTGKGLEVFDYKTEQFAAFQESLTTNFDVPIALLEDSQGNLWIGSQEQGLFRVDRTGVEVQTYTLQDGLPSNSISGILEDEVGNLWISTHRGLCKFDEGVKNPDRVRFHVYSVEDGLQGSEFKRGAYCKTKDGKMVFAGQNGFNIFDPAKIKNNPFIPPVVITGFKLFNKNVTFPESNILQAPISETRSLTLTSDQSVFTFEFSALNFMLSEKNQYAYLMEGFEETWNYVGTQNHATYTNLDAGDYIFRVKASNNDGIWNETGTQIKLILLPPWWENLYFRLGVILILSGGIFTYYRLRTYQLKQSKKELERQVAIRTADLEAATALSEAHQKEILQKNEVLVQKNQELEQQASEIRRMAEEIQELHEAKIRFFTNISHELRTPLNLILWPLEELMQGQEKDPEQVMGKYALMHKNAKKLIALINQLLDLRKVETGTLTLHLRKGDVAAAIRETVESFNDWAQRKQVDYQLHTQLEEWEICFDKDKLDKILSNLLSNAFKFVEEGGNIRVEVQKAEEESGQKLQVTVKDDGKGIPEEQLSLIFNRFYEGEKSKFPGSGIGLSLVKELLELQNGTIAVESKENEGAAFTFSIPADLTCMEEALPVKESLQVPPVSLSPEVHGDEAEEGSQVPLLLLIEDNPDILQYMQAKLSPDYQIALARNGLEGFQLATEEVPDLIISDVMMPEMDGLELCKKLKTDERTSHIPIILVTARSEEEHQLRGLAIGADDYIPKPFELQLLKLKIKNILFTRQKLKEQFWKDTLTIPDHFHISSVDEAFLKQASQVVKDNLHHTGFGVEDFSKHFGMSRRNVLRKMKGITGLSISEYIRNVRLNEAYRLLLQGALNVSEVAYEVGYTDPKYFSNSFKKHFGMSPSEVRPQEEE